MKLLIRSVVVIFFFISLPVHAQFDAVSVSIRITNPSIKHEIKTYCRPFDKEGKKYFIEYNGFIIRNNKYEINDSKLIELSYDDFNRITECAKEISSIELMSEMDLDKGIIIDDGTWIEMQVSVIMSFSVSYKLSWPYEGQTTREQNTHDQIRIIIEDLCVLAGIDYHLILKDCNRDGNNHN